MCSACLFVACRLSAGFVACSMTCGLNGWLWKCWHCHFKKKKKNLRKWIKMLRSVRLKKHNLLFFLKNSSYNREINVMCNVRNKCLFGSVSLKAMNDYI